MSWLSMSGRGLGGDTTDDRRPSSALRRTGGGTGRGTRAGARGGAAREPQREGAPPLEHLAPRHGAVLGLLRAVGGAAIALRPQPVDARPGRVVVALRAREGPKPCPGPLRAPRGAPGTPPPSAREATQTYALEKRVARDGGGERRFPPGNTNSDSSESRLVSRPGGAGKASRHRRAAVRSGQNTIAQSTLASDAPRAQGGRRTPRRAPRVAPGAPAPLRARHRLLGTVIYARALTGALEASDGRAGALLASRPAPTGSTSLFEKSWSGLRP